MNFVTGSRTLLTLACPPWSLLPAPRESSALSVEGQDVHVFVQYVAARIDRAPESGCDGDLCMHRWHDSARAAIAKARGR